jgi:hypothetical protein
VIGVILVVVSLFGLWIGISLTQPNKQNIIDLSGPGHFFVALSILVGIAGGCLIASGSRPADVSTSISVAPRDRTVVR